MGSPQIAMPLFADTVPDRQEAVVAAWQRLSANGPQLVALQGKGGIDEYAIDGRSVFVAHVAAPIPNDESRHAVRTSWMWRGSDDVLQSHRAHAIVTATQQESALAGAWDVAQVSAALLAAGSGVALYWGSSRQVHTAKIAIQFGASPSTAPVPLCVGIRISAAAQTGPFSASTCGLEALGHKEFEVRDTKMGIGELRMTLLDLAGYVLDNGPVLMHGQTTGLTAAARWKVSHEPSQLMKGHDVIVLAIP